MGQSKNYYSIEFGPSFLLLLFWVLKKKLLSSQKSIERVRQKSNKIQGLSHRARKIEMERSHLEAHRENVKTQNILIYWVETLWVEIFLNFLQKLFSDFKFLAIFNEVFVTKFALGLADSSLIWSWPQTINSLFCFIFCDIVSRLFGHVEEEEVVVVVELTGSIFQLFFSRRSFQEHYFAPFVNAEDFFLLLMDILFMSSYLLQN